MTTPNETENANGITARPNGAPGRFDVLYSGEVLVTSTTTPFLAGCRALLARGFDPNAVVVMRHEGSSVDSLRGRIGKAAELTVLEREKGCAPVFHDGDPSTAEESPETPPSEDPPVENATPDRPQKAFTSFTGSVSVRFGPARGVTLAHPLKSASFSVTAGHWADAYLTEPGYTYFIRAVHPIARIKIGCSEEIDNRIKALQTSSCTPLEVLKVIPGGFRMEQACHVRFAAYRVHLEWFDQADELLAEIRLMPAAARYSHLTHPDFINPRLAREPERAEVEERMWRRAV